MYRLALCLLVLVVSAAYAADECNTVMGYFYPSCYGSCPERKDGTDILEQVLKSQVFGQDAAIEKVVRIVRSKRPGTQIKIHFFGDNGVGKTLTAKIMAQSMFSTHDSRTGQVRGLLYLRGNSYQRETEEEVFGQRTRLRAELLAGIKACPKSLIVLDEAELPDASVLQAFEEFLSGDVVDGVHTADASFVFISDFGSAQNPNVTLAHLEDVALAESAELWNGTKFDHMVTHRVAFRPMASEFGRAIELYISSLIQGLVDSPPALFAAKKIKFDGFEGNQAKRIAEALFAMCTGKRSLASRNYRCLEQGFESEIVLPIIGLLTDRRKPVTAPCVKVALRKGGSTPASFVPC